MALKNYPGVICILVFVRTCVLLFAFFFLLLLFSSENKVNLYKKALLSQR